MRPSTRPQCSWSRLSLLCIAIFNVCSATAQLTGSCKQPAHGAGMLPTNGTVQASMIFVDFPNFPANETVEDLINVVSPSNISNFLKQSSFQQLDLQLTVHSERYYRMPKPTDQYRYGVPLTAEAQQAYVSDALAAVGTNITFHGTQLLYVTPARLAGLSISFSSTGFFQVVAGDGTVIPNVITLGLDFLEPVSSIASAALTTSYSLGMRFQCPPALGDGSGDPYLGGFSPACDSTPLAPDYLARQKWTFGWLNESSEVACVSNTAATSQAINTTLTLSAIESMPADDETMPQPHAKLAIMPLTDSLSLYAEARTQTGDDENACISGQGMGGVLLYAANVSTGPNDPDPVFLVNPGLNAYPSGCGSDRRGFLALLGLSDTNQVNNFTIPNTGVRVTVLSENKNHDQFAVRFESGVSEQTSPSASPSTGVTGPTQSTKPSEAMRWGSGRGYLLSLVVTALLMLA